MIMKAKEILKKVCTNFINLESCGIATINELSPVSGWFPIADECDVEDGEYFYVYLEDELKMKETEVFLGQPFDYSFPLCDSNEWVGIVAIED